MKEIEVSDNVFVQVYDGGSGIGIIDKELSVAIVISKVDVLVHALLEAKAIMFVKNMDNLECPVELRVNYGTCKGPTKK